MCLVLTIRLFVNIKEDAVPELTRKLVVKNIQI